MAGQAHLSQLDLHRATVIKVFDINNVGILPVAGATVVDAFQYFVPSQ